VRLPPNNATRQRADLPSTVRTSRHSGGRRRHLSDRVLCRGHRHRLLRLRRQSRWSTPGRHLMADTDEKERERDSPAAGRPRTATAMLAAWGDGRRRRGRERRRGRSAHPAKACATNDASSGELARRPPTPPTGSSAEFPPAHQIHSSADRAFTTTHRRFHRRTQRRAVCENSGQIRGQSSSRTPAPLAPDVSFLALPAALGARCVGSSLGRCFQRVSPRPCSNKVR